MAELRIRALHHRYGSIESLHSIDLDCPGAAITCLLGPSGCGKSTLLRCIAGHEHIRSGSIQLGGRILADANTFVPPEGRQVGMVFQDYALFPHLKVWQNAAFGLRAMRKADRRNIALEALERTGVADLADRYPHTCSGGQQHRIALARAIAARPRVLLLDEPFSSLDTNLRDALRHDLRQTLADAGITTVMVTHDPQEALTCADRIAVLRAGTLVQVGTPEDLWCRPADIDVMAFFGPVHRFAATVDNGICRSSLGTWPCDQADGPCIVAVRDEAITIGDTGAPATVLSQHVFGAERRLEVGLYGDDIMTLTVRDRGFPIESCALQVDQRFVSYFAVPENDATGMLSAPKSPRAAVTPHRRIIAE